MNQKKYYSAMSFEHRIEQIDYHQYQFLIKKSKILESLKHKKVSAKTKTEMIIVVKGLQATL
ncbi:hypothetical protein ACFLRN_05385 [Thermoproteota archaeon]